MSSDTLPHHPLTDDTLTVPRAVVRHGATTLVAVEGLHLTPGRPLTVVGESGSGKSVLAHALMGTLPPELEAEGSMLLGGRRFDLADRRGRRGLWGRHLALLPQEPSSALDPTMRVRQQVAEGAAGWRPRDRALLDEADRALAGLGLPPGAGAAYPHTLSGGMAQRVAYAAATIGGARVLVVDEPSKGLDPVALDRLAELLGAHAADGGLLLTITHDLGLARRLGGDVLVMRGAAVVEHGPTAQVLGSPGQEYTRDLVAAEPSRWSYPWMRDRSSPLDRPPDAATLVAARGISKSYGDTAVLRDVSLTVRAGERWALGGPSGVGKTTLGNALLGLVPVDSGEVEHPGPRRPGRFQKLYQDPAASFPRRVSLLTAMRDTARRYDVDEARVRALMDRVRLPVDLLRRRPDQVSGGELQRVAIVRALLPRPSLVLADEPTSRLDLRTQASTMDSLMTEVDATGCALVLVTHDADLAAAVTDRHLRLAPATAR